MGYKLRRQVRDMLPPGLLTQGERAVLLEIADDANDDTRQAWPGLDELARRVDMDRDSVSKCLQRLAKKGIELRVAVGKDAKGKPIYAYSGHRTTYRVPVLPSEKPRPLSAHKDGPPSDQTEEKGGQPSQGRADSHPERADHDPLKDGPPSAPSPHVPSTSPQRDLSPQRNAPDSLLAALGATEEERELLIKELKAKYNPGSNAWWRKCADNGDLADWLAQHRTGASIDGNTPAWCGKCSDARKRQVYVEDQYGGGTRPRRCPTCHPSVAVPASRPQNGNGWEGPYLNPTGPGAYSGYRNDKLPAFPRGHQPYRDDPNADYHGEL